MHSPPCAFEFISRACFDNHKKSNAKGKNLYVSVSYVALRVKECRLANITKVIRDLVKNCIQNNEGRLYSMSQLQNWLPAGDKVLYVFYVFETTQSQKYSDRTLHVTILVCVQQLFSWCEMLKTWSETECNAARGSTRSGTIRSGTCYLICLNHAPV
jgi:hypothetical protein